MTAFATERYIHASRDTFRAPPTSSADLKLGQLSVPYQQSVGIIDHLQ